MRNVRLLRQTIHAAADAAEKVALRHFGKLQSVDHKGAVDLLTIADKQAQDAIIQTILEKFPDHAFLAEESNAPEASTKQDYLWVIDPLDGTMNYAHSMPGFVISIALQYKGQTQLALISDPIRKERFFAHCGGGAFLNRRRINVSSVSRLADALLVTEFPSDRRDNPEHFLVLIRAFMMRCQGLRFNGSMALDLAWIACGRLDGIWQNHPSPWDMAAGNLLIEEAGGRVTRLNGKKHSIHDGQALCSNGKIHRAMQRVVAEHWVEF